MLLCWVKQWERFRILLGFSWIPLILFPFIVNVNENNQPTNDDDDEWITNFVSSYLANIMTTITLPSDNKREEATKHSKEVGKDSLEASCPSRLIYSAGWELANWLVSYGRFCCLFVNNVNSASVVVVVVVVSQLSIRLEECRIKVLIVMRSKLVRDAPSFV